MPISLPRYASLAFLLGAGASLTSTHIQAQASRRATATAPVAAVLHLPQLPEGGGEMALVRAIQQRVVYPRSALRRGLQGQCQVSFAVAPDGQIRRIRILRSLTPDLDTAVIAAVRQLPHLTPATQQGKPVACLMTAPVTFRLAGAPRYGRRPLPVVDSTRLYTAVEELPLYQGQPGYGKLSADLEAEYLRLGGAAGCFVSRRNLGVLLTVSPTGYLRNVRIAKPDKQECEALATEYGDAVAQQEEDELPAACETLLGQAAQALSRLTPASADGRSVAIELQLTLLTPGK